MTKKTKLPTGRLKLAYEAIASLVNKMELQQKMMDEQKERVKSMIDCANKILAEIPSKNEGGYFVDYHTPDGEYAGTDCVNAEYILESVIVSIEELIDIGRGIKR